MKFVFVPVTLLLLLLIFVFCGPKSTSPDVNAPVSGKITLDAGSALLAAFTVQSPSGAVLTIDSGTIVLMLDTTGTAQPIPAGANVSIALDDGDAGNRIDITGIVTVAQFRITATVNGKAAELRFMSNAAATTSGMPNSGAHWTATLTDTAIHAGSRINLYRISGGTDTLIGSQTVGIPTRVLAKKSAGAGQQTSVSPDGTGSYQAGSDNGSASSQATMPASGVYWNTYSNMPDTIIDLGGGVTVGGPLAVDYLEIGELSTAELIGGFSFEPGITCATYSRDGAQYWVELTQAADGKTTSIKVAATVANIFYLSMRLVNAGTRMPILFVTGLQPDGNGVHAPDGSVISDPYEDPSLKFGGFKLLRIMTKDMTKGTKLRAKIEGAGYQTSRFYFANNIYEIDVNQTLDGRKKIEEDVLKKEGWLPVKGSATWRNVGLYNHNDTLYINIDSHGSGDKVNQMVQTLSGTFTNANGDPDTVQRMNVAWTALGQMDSVPATMSNNGTSFSVACSLYTGDNMFIFQPYINDQYGQLSYQTHQVVKAKGVKTPLFTLNYKERRLGVLTVHAVTTTWTHEPDSSISVKDVTTMANLTMTPEQVVLSTIKNSASAASTCASNLTCSILSGVSDSDQTVTVSEQYHSSAHWDCDRQKPITEMSNGGGSMDFTQYGLAHVYATLLPPGTGTDRSYSLTVNIAATLQMMSVPNNASKGKIWSCPDSAWKDATGSIWPGVSLTKSDDPVILQFGNSTALEDWVAAPTSSQSWSFFGTKYSADSMSVTVYDATLSVSAP